MKISNLLKLIFTAAIGSCFAPKPAPTETDKIKELHGQFAKDVAAREKAGISTGGFATRRTLFGKRVLTDDSKAKLETSAAMHKNNGKPYGQYATSMDHQAIINKATDKMDGKRTTNPKLTKSAKPAKPTKRR
jgi:hypothetical protein